MKLYNTLTGRKEEFVGGDPVKMYVCGVTPYDSVHVGHAMSYIVFDVLRRYLEYKGYNVRHVQNFTDVDDKIIQRAARLGTSPRNLAEGLIAQYFVDMDALNIERAHVYPRATEEIPSMIEMVKGLIAKGHAYQSRGDVYFRVRSFLGYGKLSRRNLEGMMAGARIEVGESKEHPMDFTLWKESKPGEPRWESPWGMGRPGWHIECSTMALKYLGQTLDIHGGGQDLIFPHHENEIAQSECFTGVEPFARVWVHNGLLQFGEEKMSKSTGKLVTVKEVLAQCGSDALRLFVLSSHYRSPLTYSDEELAAMRRVAARLYLAATTQSSEGSSGIDPEPFKRRFLEAMEDDLNTAQAVAVLFELARETNRGREAGLNINGAQSLLRELAGVLGLTMKGEERGAPAEAEPFIQLLIETRSRLREAKQWALADVIRERLGELGVVLEDTRQGTVWKYRDR